MADGVGPVQRHGRCLSRHAVRAERLSLRDDSFDHLRRGASLFDVMAPATHPLAQGLCADLARAYAFAASAVARARAAWVPRLPDCRGRHNSVGAGASLVLCARRDRSRAGKPARTARSSSWLAVLATRLVRPGDRLSCVYGGRFLERARARLSPSHEGRAADAALLAADLGRRLPGALAVHDRTLRVG